MSIWANIMDWAAKERPNVAKAEVLIRAGIAGYEGYQSGAHTSVLAAINAAVPEAIPIIEEVASVLGGPAAAVGVEVLVQMLAYSQPLVPCSPEEQAWFDKATGTTRDGIRSTTDGW